MKKYAILILISLLLILITAGLWGCSSSPAAPDAAEGVSVLDADLSAAPDAEADLAAGTASTADDTVDDENPVADAQEPDYCIECHSNQQALIDSAKPEEELISENEGEG